MPLSHDRTDPETVAWLDLCRSQRRDLSPERFEELVPEFIRAHDDLEAAAKRRRAH